MSFMRCHLLGRHVLHALGHLVEVALHQLLAQLVHQLLEPLARGVVHELVLLQLLHLAGEVGRQHVELQRRSLGRRSSAISWRRWSPDWRGLVDAARRCPRAPVDDLVELLGDVVVDAAEVVALELLAPALAQLLEHLAQAHELARRCGPGSPAACIRRSAALRSPWYSRSSVISSSSASASRSKPIWVPSQREYRKPAGRGRVDGVARIEGDPCRPGPRPDCPARLLAATSGRDTGDMPHVPPHRPGSRRSCSSPASLGAACSGDERPEHRQGPARRSARPAYDFEQELNRQIETGEKHLDKQLAAGARRWPSRRRRTISPDVDAFLDAMRRVDGTTRRSRRNKTFQQRAQKIVDNVNRLRQQRLRPASSRTASSAVIVTPDATAAVSPRPR